MWLDQHPSLIQVYGADAVFKFQGWRAGQLAQGERRVTETSSHHLPTYWGFVHLSYRDILWNTKKLSTCCAVFLAVQDDSNCHVHYQSYSNDRHGKNFIAIILAVLDECDLSDLWSEGWGDRVDKHVQHSLTECDISSRDFSVSGVFFIFFRVSVSVSTNCEIQRNYPPVVLSF